MSNENFIHAIPALSSVSHNENAKMSDFSKLQNNLSPYTIKADKLSDLDSKKPFISTLTKTTKLSSALSFLISDSTILARVEASPYLRAAILSNPWLADEIINSPGLLTAIIRSPGLLTSLISNPGFLSSIKDNPALLAEIMKNPALSIESILERLAKRPETNFLSNTKNDSPQAPHSLDKSIIAAERARPAIRALLSRVKVVGTESIEVQKQQTSQVFETKALEARAPIKALIIPTVKPTAYFDARLFAINPSLLAVLGAAAFTANRGRIIPASGSLKDVAIELETQSESQPDAIQELDQVERIGEAGELHSVLRS